jgi:hypothetical protein
MNCRDDCAGLCLLRRFSEEVSDQWIRPTEKNFLSKLKNKQGRELIYELSGLDFAFSLNLAQNSNPARYWMQLCEETVGHD